MLPLSTPTDESSTLSGPNSKLMSQNLTKTPLLHPLEHAWVVWYGDRSSRLLGEKENWEKSLIQISEIDTVESFWSVVSHIKRPSALAFGAEYSLFRKGIKPSWEDPKNKEGGQWIITLNEQDDLIKLNAAWENLILSLIGEYFFDSLEFTCEGIENWIVGAVLTRRRHHTRLALWISRSEPQAFVQAVGQAVRSIVLAQISLKFVTHRSMIESKTS